MTVEFQTVSITVPRGKGRRTIKGTATFSSTVLAAGVALNGFKFDFSRSDHHINVIEADTDYLGKSGKKVNFRIQCQYADKNFDDEYSGFVTALVIARVK